MGKAWAATRFIFFHISRVGHVQNPYQPCWSHDHHISRVERRTYTASTVHTKTKVNCYCQYFDFLSYLHDD